MTYVIPATPLQWMAGIGRHQGRHEPQQGSPCHCQAPLNLPALHHLTDLHQSMDRWFSEVARVLPWRSPDCSPWGILVSEVMLQQTPVVRVLPVWEDWMERWPEPCGSRQAALG